MNYQQLYSKIYEESTQKNALDLDEAYARLKRVKEMIIKLSPQAIKDLGKSISSKSIFETPIFEIKLKSGPITKGGVAFFSIKAVGGQQSPENIEKLSKVINIDGNYAFDIQDKELAGIFELSYSGDRVAIPLKMSNQEKPITIHFVREDSLSQSSSAKITTNEPIDFQEPAEEIKEPVGSALTSGIIDTTSENNSVKSFDSFILEKNRKK